MNIRQSALAVVLFVGGYVDGHGSNVSHVESATIPTICSYLMNIAGAAASGTQAARDAGTALRTAVYGAPTSASDCGVVSLGAGYYDVGRGGTVETVDAISIVGKYNLTVSGAGIGQSFVKFDRNVSVGFALEAGTHGLTLKNMTISGRITSSPYSSSSTDPMSCTGVCALPPTHAIGTHFNRSGFSDLTFTDLEILDVAVGISVGSLIDAGGVTTCNTADWARVLIARNTIRSPHGTRGGSGYGIQNGCASDVEIVSNRIFRADRHAIYQGAGTNIRIHRNLIVDHRRGVPPSDYSEAMGWVLAAMPIARSTNVTAAQNVFFRSHEIALTAESALPDDGFQAGADKICLVGNVFVAGETSSDIMIETKYGGNSRYGTSVIWFNRRPGGQYAVTDLRSGTLKDAEVCAERET